MPYIKQEGRKDLITSLSYVNPVSPGYLNYAITRICHKYLAATGLRYVNFNEVIGVLECVKQELYRQVVAPYEDVKKKENGNISELDKD